MKRILLGTLAAAAVSLSPFTLISAAAQSDQQPSREERMQHWAADHEAMMDARLGGMKEALKPTASQYPSGKPLRTLCETRIRRAWTTCAR